MWFLIALLAALLALFGGNPNPSPKPAAVAAAAVCGASLDGASLTATGLTPGDRYFASFEFTADDGGVGFNLGHSDLWVKTDGTVTFQNETADVDPRGVPGTVRAWLHAALPFDSPAAVCPDGAPLEATGRLP